MGASIKFYKEGQPFLDRFDQNRDGIITRSEFADMAFERFVDIDTNRDGVITSLDRNVRYMNADQNRDGIITRSEYDAMIFGHFDRMDRNRDGKIDLRDRPFSW